MLLGPSNVRHKKLNKMAKKDLRTTICMLTGHAPLNIRLSIMGILNTERCRFCKTAREITTHLLTERCEKDDLEQATS